MSSSRVEIVPPPKPPKSKNLEGMGFILPQLLQPPFFGGIVGPRHSGKTVLLFNLLSNRPGFYGSAFRKNNIILYSPTKDKDETLKALKLVNAYGPQDDPEAIVADVLMRQQAYEEADNMTGVLMVFDDITQIRNAWRPLENLSYTGRHSHVHVLYVSHKLSSIPRGIRTQTQQWMIFKPHEQSEREWILKMFGEKQTYHVWNAALVRCWKIEYNFAFIDYERKSEDEIYRSGFNDPLFTPEELAVISGDGDYMHVSQPCNERVDIKWTEKDEKELREREMLKLLRGVKQ